MKALSGQVSALKVVAGPSLPFLFRRTMTELVVLATALGEAHLVSHRSRTTMPGAAPMRERVFRKV